MSMHYSEAHGNGMKKKDLLKIIAKKRKAAHVMKPGMPHSKKHKKSHRGMRGMMGMGG